MVDAYVSLTRPNFSVIQIRMSLLDQFDSLVGKLRPTNSELRAIAKICGIPLPQKPTKAGIVETIRQNAVVPKRASPVIISGQPISLVSIDVGLRNFALTRFAVPPYGATQKPTVLQWCKLNLPRYTGIEDSSFNPVDYARIVQKTLFNFVLAQPSPDVIVVERQRFRTAGGRNVHENILKSNAVEYMLFAALETYKALRPGFSNTLCVSSSPKVMASYWEQVYLEATGEEAGENNSKVIRMKLVDAWIRWLFDNEGTIVTPFEFSGPIRAGMDKKEVDKVLKRFRSPSRRVYEWMRLANEANSDQYRVDLAESGVEKGDDVTDSLLHGLAYLHFEDNKERLRRNIQRGKLI